MALALSGSGATFGVRGHGAHTMNRILPWLWLFVILLIAGQRPLRAQSQSETFIPSARRTFVTKSGDQLTARIISLSSDAKSITLRTPDELDHHMEVTALSLDNQIFVRDWVEAQAVRKSSDAPGQVELTVENEVTKFERRTFPVDGRRITHEQMHQCYRLQLSQPEPATRVVLRAAYLILYREKVAVYEVADGSRTDWSSLGGRGRVHYRYGNFRLPVNRLSALQERNTDPVKIDRLEGETEADRLGHDQLIGIQVRVEDPFGNLVAEFTDLPDAYAGLGWVAINAARQDGELVDDSGSATGVLKLKPVEGER